MDCDEQGYWDTSGYCHWSKKAYHRREEFDLDDEEGLTKAIACFIEEYPQGEYEIYVIQSYREWNKQDDEHESKIANIGQKAISLAQKIKEEKRLKEIEEKNKQKAKEQERIKQQELKKLEELKAKYEQGN